MSKPRDVRDRTNILWRHLKRLLCQACRSDVARWIKERPALRRKEKASYHRALRNKRKQAKLCTLCGRPAPKGVHCSECRKQVRVQHRRLMGHNAWKPGGKGRPPYDRKEK